MSEEVRAHERTLQMEAFQAGWDAAKEQCEIEVIMYATRSEEGDMEVGIFNSTEPVAAELTEAYPTTIYFFAAVKEL